MTTFREILKRALWAGALLLLAIGASVVIAPPAVRAQSNANVCFNVLPYASRTAATVNSGLLGNLSYRGVLVTANVSTVVSGNYALHIQAPVNSSPTLFYDILVSPNVSSQSSSTVTLMTVYPGAAVTANVSASAVLPKVWRVQAIGTSSPSMTFSVDACLLN